MNDIIFKQNAEANLRKSLLLLENNGYFVNYKLDTKVEKQFQNYASQAFRQALKATIINNSSNNWFFLAQVYKNYLGLVENSEKWSNLAFAKAVALQPSNINNYLQWGSLFVLRNKFDQAFEIYNQALKIDPNSSLVNYHLASLMVKKNDFRLALEYYNLALVNLDEGESFLENRLKIIQEIKLINEKNGNNNNNQLNLDRE